MDAAVVQRCVDAVGQRVSQGFAQVVARVLADTQAARHDAG